MPKHRRSLSALIGELATRSDTFRKLWGVHTIREHRTGHKRIHHASVGDLELGYEALQLSDDRGLQLVAWTAEPTSPSNIALQLLGNLAATDPSTTTLIERLGSKNPSAIAD